MTLKRFLVLAAMAAVLVTYFTLDEAFSWRAFMHSASYLALWAAVWNLRVKSRRWAKSN